MPRFTCNGGDQGKSEAVDDDFGGAFPQRIDRERLFFKTCAISITSSSR